MIGIIAYVLIAAGSWRIFEKMGREGWEGIIPFYSTYVLFQELYGSGWKMLLFLIPIYHIYVAIKFNVDLAHAFHQSGAYAVGLLLLPYVFYPMLGFGGAVYGDGSADHVGDNPISQGLNDLSGQISGMGKKEDVFEKISRLDELRKSGAITEEEYEKKKAELMSRI